MPENNSFDIGIVIRSSSLIIETSFGKFKVKKTKEQFHNSLTLPVAYKVFDSESINNLVPN